MTLKEAVLEALGTGKKGVELIADSLVVFYENNKELPEAANTLPDLLEEMVNDGELVEVEYVLPGTSRIKSFYLPKGTQVI